LEGIPVAVFFLEDGLFKIITMIKFNAAYYEYGKGKYYKTVEGDAYIIPELPDYSFALHKEGNEYEPYVIREILSGEVIARSKSRKGLRAAVEDKLNKYTVERCRAMINYCIKEIENKK
jgi:hypothetical protein